MAAVEVDLGECDGVDCGTWETRKREPEGVYQWSSGDVGAAFAAVASAAEAPAAGVGDGDGPGPEPLVWAFDLQTLISMLV